MNSPLAIIKAIINTGT